jgi:DNA-directed RNA polymerase specialized sigma24 family protein
MSGDPYTTLDVLITSALTQGRYNHLRFSKETRRYAIAIARKRGADLPEDIQEEVWTQAVVHLLEAGPTALARGGGKAAFRRAVLKAIRTTRAANIAPGRRTRRDAPGKGRIAADAAGALGVIEGMGADGKALVDAPDDSARAAFVAVENRLAIRAALDNAPPPVRAALYLIHERGRPVAETAEASGIDRFELHRRIKAAFHHHRLAA